MSFFKTFVVIYLLENWSITYCLLERVIWKWFTICFGFLSPISTCFLMGPLKQLKAMFDPKRLIATIVMLVNILSFFPFIKKFSFSLKAKFDAFLKWGYFSICLFLLQRNDSKAVKLCMSQRSYSSFLGTCVFLLFMIFYLIIWSKIFLMKCFLVNYNGRLIIFNLFSKIFSSRARGETFLANVESQWPPGVAWQWFFGCSWSVKVSGSALSKQWRKLIYFPRV